MRRATLIRATGMIALIGLYVAALAIINRDDSQVERAGSAHKASPVGNDDLSAELKRCNALGPQDPDVAHCEAIWTENRRRFFGLAAKTPLRADQPPTSASPTTPGASSAKPQSSNAGGRAR